MALIKFKDMFGFIPANQNEQTSVQENVEIKFVEAYNHFMEPEYGIENAWNHKAISCCNKRITVMAGTL